MAYFILNVIISPQVQYCRFHDGLVRNAHMLFESENILSMKEGIWKGLMSKPEPVIIMIRQCLQTRYLKLRTPCTQKYYFDHYIILNKWFLCSRPLLDLVYPSGGNLGLDFANGKFAKFKFRLYYWNSKIKIMRNLTNLSQVAKLNSVYNFIL